MILGIFPLFSKKNSTEDQKIIDFVKLHFGFKPKILKLFKKALVHKSASNNRLKDVHFNNERLEFLGDSVLDTIIATEVYSKYLKHREGDLTKFKSKVVNRSTLNIIADSLKITDLLQTEVKKTSQNSDIAGNALEAIIGAVFLDKGYDYTSKTVLKLFKKHINLQKLELIESDYKSKLLEYAQKNKITVTFEITNIVDNHNRKLYTANVLLNGETKGNGKGSSKKKAEQEAAEDAVKNSVLLIVKTV